MDKIQKELISTYFRKRNIIGNKNPKTRTPQDVEYILKHPEMFDIESLKFTPLGWLDDIIKHPEIIKNYNLEYNDYRFKYWEADILKFLPGLVDLMDLGSIRTQQAIDILYARPELIKKFPQDVLENIESYDLGPLLIKRPELIEYFDLNSLGEYVISDLALEYPEVLKKYNTNKLGVYSVTNLIRNNPSLLKYLDIQNRGDYDQIVKTLLLDGKKLYEILQYPEAASKLEFKNPYSVSQAIIAEPRLINHIDISQMPSRHLKDILVEHPELVKNVDINKLDEYDFTDLLTKHPEFINSPYDLSRIYYGDMKTLMMLHPEFFDRFYEVRNKKASGLDLFTFFDMVDLIMMIKAQPSLRPKLQPYIDRLKKRSWLI